MEKIQNLNTSYHQSRIEFAEKIYANPELLPHRYVFVLTNRCNLKCSFCFQEKDKIDGSLSKDDWLEVVKQLPSYAHVTLTGGEPFIFKGFKDVFEFVTQKHTCNIISNGVLLNDEIIDLLLSKENFKVLSISIDNIGNTLRDVVPNQWNNAEIHMRKFVEKRNALNSDTILDSKTVILDENADSLLDIHRYCIESLKCDTHSFMLLKGAPIQYSDHMYELSFMDNKYKAYKYKNFDSIINQLELVRKYNIDNNKKCYLHPKIVDLNSEKSLYDTNLELINFEDHKPDFFKPCKAPWESIHINVDGNVFPCMAINMGNIKKRQLPSIISSETFLAFKDNIKKNGTVGGCNRCGYLLPK